MAHIPYGGDLIGREPEFTDRDIQLHREHLSSSLAIARLCGSLTHSLNNLLTVTMGYVERAHKMARDPQLKRTLDHAKTGADNMAASLYQLQSFASEGRQPNETACVKAALDDALQLLRVKHPDVDFHVVVDQPQRVDANALELTRMFMNFMDNAIESLETRRYVGVRIRDITTQNHPLGIRDGDYVVITVADTGKGILPPYLPRIFEPFFTTKANGQMGMGLSWAWGFIRNCRGAVRVRSEVNQGSSFEIFLPLGVNTPKRVPAPVVAMRPNARKRVLIVEDNADILDIIHAAMIGLNYHTVTARNSQEARAIIESQEFDLVLTDVIIPGDLNGSELADMAIDLHPCTKVLLVTGRLNRQDIQINPYHTMLLKPFSMDKLTRTVKSVLKD